MHEQGEILDEMAEQASVATVDGLSPQELTLLAVTASSVAMDDYATSLWGVRNACELACLNNLGLNLGLRRLKAKRLIESVEVQEEQEGDSSPGIQVTEIGWQWIEANEDKFTFHTTSVKKAPAALFDDEIPF